MKNKKRNTRRQQRINYLKTKLGFFKKASWDGIKPIFIVSTGRTGTRSLDVFFSSILPKVYSCHEPDPDFLKLGVDYARGKVSKDRAVKTIKERRLWICDYLNKNNKTVYIEANNRYFSLIPALWQAFPDAKIIHITRDARDVVRSTMTRGFYTPSDGIYYRKNLRMQATDFANDPYYDKWQSMDQFQKAVWHWVKKDSFIHKDLKDDKRSIRIKFEDIFDKENGYQGLWQMVKFMDIGIGERTFQKQCRLTMEKKFNINRKEYYPNWLEWSLEQRKQFCDIAGQHMKLCGYDMDGFV